MRSACIESDRGLGSQLAQKLHRRPPPPSRTSDPTRAGGQGLTHPGRTLSLPGWRQKNQLLLACGPHFSEHKQSPTSSSSAHSTRANPIAVFFSKMEVTVTSISQTPPPPYTHRGPALAADPQRLCVHPACVFPSHPTLFVEINMEIRLSKTAKPAKLK